MVILPSSSVGRSLVRSLEMAGYERIHTAASLEQFQAAKGELALAVIALWSDSDSALFKQFQEELSSIKRQSLFVTTLFAFGSCRPDPEYPDLWDLVVGAESPLHEGVARFTDLLVHRRLQSSVPARQKGVPCVDSSSANLLNQIPALPILTALGLPSLFVDGQTGLIHWSSKEAQALFGYTESELAGQPVEILVPDNLRRDHAALRFRYSLTPRVRALGAHEPLRARRKDGIEVQVDISLSPVNSCILVILRSREAQGSLPPAR